MELLIFQDSESSKNPRANRALGAQTPMPRSSRRPYANIANFIQSPESAVKMASVGISVLLGISTTEQLNQFLHHCIDILVGKIGTPLNNINGEIDWSQDDYKIAGKFVKNIYRNLVTNTSYNIDDELSELGSEKIDCIKKCYEIRKPEVQRAVTNECLAKMEHPVVTDFDWKLKWILGSSSLSSIRDPLLQMDLFTKHIDPDDNVTKDTIKFEMNINELKSFVIDAEKCLDEFKH